MEDSNEGINLVVVRGAVRADPVHRDTPTGTVVQFDVGTPDGSVPVAWSEPTQAAMAPISEGVEVLVVGAVRRRFFRVGGATQSRTEVVPTQVLPARRHRQVQRAVEGVIELLSA